MTVTIDKYDRISRAYAEARTLAAEIQPIKDAMRNAAWMDQQGKDELAAALKGMADRKKQQVIDVINDQTPVKP
ncbi:hypothetical protein D3C75_1159420 [compost metagenome]